MSENVNGAQAAKLLWKAAVPPEAPAPTEGAMVAVITRTKNRPILLARACESVLGQSFGDWLHVIVNDGGDRESVEELLAPLRPLYGKRLLVVHNEKSRGMEAASNIGIRASKSNYLVIHDDDDSWHPDFLKECVTWMEEHRPTGHHAGVVTHSIRVLESINGGRVEHVSNEDFNTWLDHVNLFRMAAINNFPPISFVFRRSVWEELNGFNEQLPVLGDWEFNLRVLAQWNIGVIPKKLANYHHRVNLQTTSYGNTVIGGNETHMTFDNIMRNDLLRDELRSGNLGLGFLLNVSREFQRLSNQQSDVSNRLWNLEQRLDAMLPKVLELADNIHWVFNWLEKGSRPARKLWWAMKPYKRRLDALRAALRS